VGSVMCIKRPEAAGDETGQGAAHRLAAGPGPAAEGHEPRAFSALIELVTA
jgi:hypothetical protein